MTEATRNRVVEKHYRQHFETQVLKLRGRLGGRAEDAVQEAYTTSLQYWDTLHNVDKFDEWFSVILSNSIRDEFAKLTP